MASELLKIAEHLIKKWEPLKALKILKELKTSERSTKIPYLLAFAYFKLWEPKKALHELTWQNSLMSKEWLLLLSKIHFELWDFENTVFFWKAFLEGNFSCDTKEYKQTMADVAFCLFKLWQYNKAKNYIKKIIESWEENSKIYEVLWKCYFNLNKYEKSLYYLNKAVYLWSEDSETFNIRWAIFAKNKNYDLAILEVNKSLEISPENQDLYYNKAYYLFLHNYISEAIEVCRTWLSLEKSHYDLNILSVMCELKNGKIENAKNLALENIAKFWKSWEFHLLLWQIFLKENNHENAIKEFIKSEKFWNKSLSLYKLKAICFDKLNKKNNAHKELDKAIIEALKIWDMNEVQILAGIQKSLK